MGKKKNEGESYFNEWNPPSKIGKQMKSVIDEIRQEEFQELKAMTVEEKKKFLKIHCKDDMEKEKFLKEFKERIGEDFL